MAFNQDPMFQSFIGGNPGGGANPSGTSDVAELRAEPWTNDFEQRAIGRADELSGQRYNAMRQQRATDMARQGIGPDSPFWQSEMRKIDVAHADESANFRRNLQLQKIDTHFARTAQARQVEMLMDEMENRRLQELYGMVGGYAPSTDPNLMKALVYQQGQASAGVGAGFKGIGDLIAAYMATQRPQVTFNAGAGVPPYRGGYD